MINAKNNKKRTLRLYGESGAGFGIIELLVVVGIIAVISGIVITNLPQVNLWLALSRVSYNFAEDLRKTQQMALSGVAYKDSLGLECDITGYGIYVDLSNPGNKKYIMYADKAPGNKKYDTLDYEVKTVDFSTSERGVKIKEVNNTNPTNQASINFSLSDIETTITQLSSGKNHAEFVFSLESNSSIIKKVWINTAGLVEVK